MIGNGWRIVDWKAGIVKSMLYKLDKARLSDVKRLLVVGDLHGDYSSLAAVFSMFDPAEDVLVFLGDYADRGGSGVEVIQAVDALTRRRLGRVFALKGNHEDYSVTGSPRFYPRTLIAEANQKFGDWQSYFSNRLKPFLDNLRLCLIVPGEALFVHGGISSKIKGLRDLEYPTSSVATDILWSDPFDGNGEFPNPRGAGVLFGEEITANVCERLGVKRIVRSHEPARVQASGGPCYLHYRRVLTTSTTTSYGGDYKPFLLSFDPMDFSCKCFQIAADHAEEAEIVNCKFL